MKKRLIDANALVETFEKWKVEIHDAEDYNPDVYDAIDSCVAQVEDAPTVDAVEVVRCLKCRYRSQYSDDNGMYKCGGLQAGNGDAVAMVKPDFFCAYGERRANDIQTV